MTTNINSFVVKVYILSYTGTMSVVTPTKINQLINSQPSGVVFQSSWLKQQGYSYGLQKRYRKSLWLESIGTGAMIRAGDQVGYEGAIFALQNQSGLSVHPGGKTALAYLGKTHYLEMETKRVTVFGSRGEILPAWFEKYDWGVSIDYYQTSFLPKDLGMTEIDVKNFFDQSFGCGAGCDGMPISSF